MTHKKTSPAETILAATLAALGASAPKPGSSRFRHLQVQINVLPEDGKDDYPRLLSDPVREALIDAIADDLHAAETTADIVANGYHGLYFASDADVIVTAADITFDDIVASSDAGDPEEQGSLAQSILLELSEPLAAPIVTQGTYNPQNPDMGLLGSLNVQLTSLSLPNPFAEAIAEADDSQETEVARG